MTYENIRPLTMGIVWRDEEMLVQDIENPVTGEIMYRPVGGGVEFGETSDTALIREFREELGIEIENLQLIGIIENLFRFNGHQSHENAFVYTADFVDDSLYSVEQMIGDDTLNGETITYHTDWASLDEFGPDGKKLVPGRLLELLTDPEPDAKIEHYINNRIDG